MCSKILLEYSYYGGVKDVNKPNMKGRKTFFVLAVLSVLVILLLISSGSYKNYYSIEEVYTVKKDNEFIQLVAVQFKLNPYDFTHVENFKAKIDSIMNEIQNKIDPRYDALVVFPEDIGTMLVLEGMDNIISDSQTLEEGIKKAIKKYPVSIGIRKILYRTSWTRAMFLCRSKNMAKIYFDTFSNMAKKYGVYIVAGSILLPDYEIENGRYISLKPRDNNVYNISYLFGPDGLIIGRQKKVYLIDLEGPYGLDVEPADISEIRVFDTPMGKIGIAICFDAFQQDVLEKLKEQGADILVQPSANPSSWSYEQQEDWLNSSWSATAKQKLFKYAVNPMMTGSFLNLQFYGQSSIISSDMDLLGPNYIGLANTYGFIALAESFDSEEILVSKVLHP